MKIRTTHHKQGFTLVELAIVLVIIGLIVGGVLVGRDLIKAAETRATVTQLEKYMAASTTFRGKYGGIAGDMPATKVISFGLNNGIALAGGTGVGDGNGIFQESPSYSSDPPVMEGETALFFMELGQAKLINVNLGGDAANPLSTYAMTCCGQIHQPTIEKFTPQAVLGGNNVITVTSDNVSSNFYVIFDPDTYFAGSGYGTAINGLKPIQAEDIDAKMDDGYPATGAVRALDSTERLYNVTTINNVATGSPDISTAAFWNTTTGCAQGAANALTAYNGGYDGPACSLRIKFN